MRMNECSRGDFLQWIQIQQQGLFPAARKVSEFSLLESNYFCHNFFSEPPINMLREMLIKHTVNILQLLDDYFSKFLHGIQERKVKRACPRKYGFIRVFK
jgi:hypothetical protein